MTCCRQVGAAHPCPSLRLTTSHKGNTEPDHCIQFSSHSALFDTGIVERIKFLNQGTTANCDAYSFNVYYNNRHIATDPPKTHSPSHQTH